MMEGNIIQTKDFFSCFAFPLNLDPQAIDETILFLAKVGARHFSQDIVWWVFF